MIEDRNRIYDGWLSLQGGVDAGRAPDTIDPTQSESAINMTFRGGSATTRPGVRRLNETFNEIRKQVFVYNQETDFVTPSPSPGVVFTATPADNLLHTVAAHGLRIGDRVQFTSDNTLPAPLQAHTTYFVIAAGFGLNQFRVSSVFSGVAVNITTTGTGTHHILNPVHRIKGQYAPNNSEIPFEFHPDPAPGYYTAPAYVDSTESVYQNGILQCALAFSPHHGEDCIMALIGGRLFKIVPDIASARVTEVIPKDDDNIALRNSQYKTIAYMVQADKWFIAQDGESRAILFDNTTARRTVLTSDVTMTEVPVGTIMAYGMGRICVTVNLRDIAFGDLLGSHNLPDPADSLILFTERNFIAEGFDAAIPFQQGLVTGMIFFPQLDTSTGNGQLLAFAERGAASFFLSLDRAQWKTSSFQILSLLTTGMRGHRSIAVVNEDLWFRADDGVRSFRQSRSEPQGWAHIPLSTNVEQYLDNDSDWMLKYASGIYFDNRCVFTTSPMPNQGRPVHYGVVVVDFQSLSSFGANSAPAWEGQWLLSNSIWPIQSLTGTFKGVTRSFILGLEPVAAVNQLFEMSRDDNVDWDDQVIGWEMVSRSFDFQKLSQQSTPFNESDLYGGDMWLREIDSEVAIQVFYHPDDYPHWLPWQEFTQQFNLIGNPGDLDLGGKPTARPGFAPRVTLSKPPDACDDTTKRNLRRGYSFQVKFTGTGHVVFNRFRIQAQKQIEKSRAK